MAAPLGFKTFATGDVLTAADTNGYLMQGVWTFADATARDAAVTSPQEGNMCYLKSTDAVQYYSGSAWTAVGGSSFAGCYATKSADQSIANATNVAITFNTEAFDVGGYHDNVTNTSRFTVPSGKAGYYLIASKITWDTNTTGIRQINLRKNGTQFDAAILGAPPSGFNSISETAIVSLSVGDYVEAYVYQNSGVSLSVISNTSSQGYTSFSMAYLGA